MTSYEERVAKVKNGLTDHPDFPKPGILFRDIFPICRDPVLFGDLIKLLTEHIQEHCAGVEAIIGLESRGFIFGPMIAHNLGVSFVPVRKKGKLPGECVSVSYKLEYGTDEFEIQKDSLRPGQKVVIIDDLLATGGTMNAAVELMNCMKSDILECVVVIELTDLRGRHKVQAKTWSLIPLAD